MGACLVINQYSCLTLRASDLESETMRIGVFGATGNSGGYFVRNSLAQGNEVFAFGRSDIRLENESLHFFRSDISDPDIFSSFPDRLDAVVNFAGVQPSILPFSEETDFGRTVEEYIRVNIGGAKNILDYVARSKATTYVYTTSHREIESHWANGELLANDLSPGINYAGDHVMYAISKTAGKMIGEYFGHRFGFRVFNLRLPMMFLVPNNPTYLKNGTPVLMPFLQIIRSALAGENLEIWGNPGLRRDYVHVDNLVSMIDLCIASELGGGTFNVGTGEAVPTEEFVRSIAANFSPTPESVTYSYRPEQKTYKCASYDVSEQVADLGFEPVLLDDMLLRLRTELSDGDWPRKWGW